MANVVENSGKVVVKKHYFINIEQKCKVALKSMETRNVKAKV